MNPPIAYTYEADTHCPACAVARFGREPGHPWPPEAARDREGNPLGAIAPWDDWCLVCQDGIDTGTDSHSLECADCHVTIREHDAPTHDAVLVDVADLLTDVAATLGWPSIIRI